MTAELSPSIAADGPRLAFRAMGCRASVIVNGPSPLLGRAESRIAHLERVWSRFNDDSDNSIINRSDGRPRRVDPMTVVLIRAMVDGWNATGGAFDPTLLPSLVALGDPGPTGSCAAQTQLPFGALSHQTLWRGDPASIEIDLDGIVTLPAGTTLDAGGIGKGLAADIVADEMLSAGADGALVEIGGDVAVRGTAPSGGGWRIAVGDGGGLIALSQGGVATSGTERRTWMGPNGDAVHHLIDPRRLTSFNASVCEATVIAGTAAWAEVFTKFLVAASARGTAALEEALAHLDARGLGARVRHECGATGCNDAWTKFAVAGESA
jgi:FAD:protein FMN transferase